MREAGFEQRGPEGDGRSAPSAPGQPGATDRTTKGENPESSEPEGTGGAGAGAEGGDEDTFEGLDTLGDEIARLVSERDEYLDSLRRLQADFDNYRKRAMRQQTELLERASEGLVAELLPVLDALDLAEAHAAAGEAQGGGTADGNGGRSVMSQIGTLLRDTLQRQGLERIDATEVPFDPSVHDAVAHDPSSSEPAREGAEDPRGAETAARGEHSEGEKGEEAGRRPEQRRSAPARQDPRVAEVMRAGYRMKGRVLRPAMVRVRG